MSSIEVHVARVGGENRYRMWSEDDRAYLTDPLSDEELVASLIAWQIRGCAFSVLGDASASHEFSVWNRATKVDRWRKERKADPSDQRDWVAYDQKHWGSSMRTEVEQGEGGVVTITLTLTPAKGKKIFLEPKKK